MKNYLVTGCAGFIASYVCQFLLERGDHVVGVDNLNDAYDIRLKQWRLDNLCKEANFTFIKTDVSDNNALEPVFSRSFNAVIHLAARAGVRYSVDNPWVYLDTNCRGTLNLLEKCRAEGISKFVLASSSSVYGSEKRQPFSECFCTDYPCSPYAATKKAAEALAYSYYHLHQLDISVLRFFTVYGPAGRPDMSILKFIRAISEGIPFPLYGDGTQRRDFTYVTDIALGVLKALSPVGYQIFNLGGDAPVEMNYIIQLISDLTHCKPIISRKPPHPADVPATWADINLARKILNWSPNVTLETGLRRTVEWYQQNRDWVSSLNMDN